MCEVDVQQLRADLRAGGATLVDVREYPEWAAARIEGARWIPLSAFEQRAGELDRSQTIYLVCRTGRRSAEAQRMLVARGFANVVNVCGGLTSWMDAGYPVLQDRNAPWSIERQVRFTAGTIVLVGVLLSAFVAQPFVWLAGFVGAGLIFAAATDSCAMGDLIARLPWNRASNAGAACPISR